MSNLIKSVYFNVDPSKAHVIDSDKRVEEFIPNIFDVPEATPESYEFPQLGEYDEDAATAEEFTGGLSVISMADVASEEREKLEQELSEQKESILEDARRQAEEIVEQARLEADSVRDAARNEGMEQGRAEGRAEAGLELNKKKQELQDEYDARFQELMEQEEKLEPQFAELVISLVKKLTGIVCEDKRDVILYLLGNCMKKLERTQKLYVHVSHDDLGAVSAKKPTLKLIAKDVSDFDIIEDDSLSQNQCIIETDNRIIDCSLDAQLQNLEEHIKLLSVR